MSGKDTLSKSDKVFLRISIVQTVLAVIAFLTGLIALSATVTESSAIRKQTSASVWPYVQFGVENFDPETQTMLVRVSLKNSGVGPAKLKGMRIALGDRVMKNWEQLLKTAVPDEKPLFVYGFTNNRVMAANDQIDILLIKDPEYAQKVLGNLQTSNLNFEYCYCSIFEECWLVNFSGPAKQDIKKVKNCPKWGEDTFQN
ncbi:MAG TPA: hypothetical protein ENJ42_07490 [Hellea balneolensis]|uniref:Uncharacterized protein n=1 Tax=Hellea balneolensis TaxID=287478 RepID=A0A7C5QWT0_9PROT|nr:hypothetical protein [Hellea balneolensis]